MCLYECKLIVRSLLSSTSSVENNFRNLSILHTGSIIVASGVAELEGDLASVMTVDRDLPQPLGPVVAVQTLQRAHGGVVGVGLDLQGLLEHGSERRVGSVAGEGDLVGSQESSRSSMDQLNKRYHKHSLFNSSLSPGW